ASGRYRAWASSAAAGPQRSAAGAPLTKTRAPFAGVASNGRMTLVLRYHRSPRCFESGLAVRERCGAPLWRDAAACELSGSRVPWSRWTFFALDVMRAGGRIRRAAREAQAVLP